ncbi:hypothetical protein EDD34_0316 [Myceligenerans xiligouense]|uniref:Uncharacterized protein n=1 Tax=Myceligenerans xiligouense TaxID=253184 RepID=A0A3N4Z3N2_9MICO|nr:hypothetical protein EDD34_0316 [Myceligenerans xiligouense]
MRVAARLSGAGTAPGNERDAAPAVLVENAGYTRFQLWLAPVWQLYSWTGDPLSPL